MAALARLMLFLALCVGVTVSAVVDLQKRIVGGANCERPYHVELRTITADLPSIFCSGSLISDKWILTAAHCLVPGRDMFAFLSVNQAQGLKITETPVIFKDHDIMLLKLSTATTIPPVTLPNKGDCPKVDDTVKLAGHGATEPQPDVKTINTGSLNLQCADFKVTFLDKWYFYGHTPGIEACPGDSGGGVVYNNKITGVLSFGYGRICKELVGFVYLCKDEYLSWIKTTIKN